MVHLGPPTVLWSPTCNALHGASRPNTRGGREVIDITIEGRVQFDMMQARSSAPHTLEYPQMWVWPQVPLEGPPLHPPPPLHPGTPSPYTRLGRPVPEHCKKSQGGWGEEGGRGRGGKGFGLREGPSNCNGGWGGPSKHQLGPDVDQDQKFQKGVGGETGLSRRKSPHSLSAENSLRNLVRRRLLN